MQQLVRVFQEKKFLGVAFVEGIKFIKGKFGWFTSLDLLFLTGDRVDGWRYSIYPFTPLLEYKELTDEEN